MSGLLWPKTLKLGTVTVSVQNCSNEQIEGNADYSFFFFFSPTTMPERERNENSEMIIPIKLYIPMLESFSPTVD